MSIEKVIAQDFRDKENIETRKWLKEFVQKEQLVGELLSINYEKAKVIIHDHARRQVGGIPSLGFLLATRVDPDQDSIDYKNEDTSLILLRVMDSTPLPNHSEAENIRFGTAQRVSGETDKHWDEDGIMDAKTRVYLGYSGVECRIIGTFYFDKEHRNEQLSIKFGGDISNYYPNRGLKIYKPKGKALELIVNYIDNSNLQDHIKKYHTSEKVKLGYIRYASTNRKYQEVNDVPVYIYPADLLSQKTALFGMTRTGKSNTTKIIAMTVYRLRCPKEQSDSPLRIGQLIFDPNGEYANENVQDNNTALKNVWQIIPNIPESDKKNEITTYGISKHPNDPDRKLMLLNFYADHNLQIGKEIINNLFNHEDPIYIKNFVQVIFDFPDPNDKSAVTRHKRRVLTYRAILNKAGFKAPANLKPSTRGLFSKELIKYLKESEGKDKSLYIAAANVLDNDNPSWGEITTALEALNTFIISKDSGYKEFESWYVTERNDASGNYWADEDLKKLLGIFQYPNGIRRIGQANKQHTSTHDSDFADDIYEDLINGKLVIIDQSSGDPLLNDSSARRIMTKIFESNKSEFTRGNTPPDIMVYIEEAHNLLPPDNEKNYKDIWVRVAKEGAKLRIGLVYATQEVSSIQKNILKNTANWFIAHLNNTDETKELCKYYDFIDFEPSIRRAQDKGFLRVKTLSNLFVIPVQVDKFTLHSTS